ncbi:MAG: DUF348 domain-containing protein [Anaerolinea sp.]|nr:DUF348 domain-containing protein [Anaerolinea sp.]
MERSTPPTLPRPPGSLPTQPRRPAGLRVRALLPLIIAISLAAVITVTLVIGVIVLLVTLIPVTVIVDGEATQVKTRAVDVAGVLDELDLLINDGDLVTPPLTDRLEPDMVIAVTRARSVFLMVDGSTTPLWTPLTNPADLLRSAGVNVTTEDRVVVDGTLAQIADLARWPVPVTAISVRHAVDLTLVDDTATRTIRTTAATVGEALFEADITLYVSDRVYPDLNASVSSGMQVTIHRARPINIVVDGETVQTRSQGSTVGDALADAGVALVGLDYAIPDEETALLPGMSIRIIRVTEDITTTSAAIPYETIYQADSTLEIDQRRVLQTGTAGTQTTTIRVRYENGIEVDRAEESTIVTTPAQNHIIAYGTNVVIRTVETPEGTREYWRKLRMYATSYHPAALGGDNITATGRTLQRGIVGADIDVLPYGTQIYVPNYGVGLIADTGAERHDPMWVDLGYSDSDWRSWSGYVDVYILTPVPADIDYFLTD